MNENAPDAGGIVFFRTASLDGVVEFYVERVGMTVAVTQPDCTILERDGFYLGFCDRAEPDTDGIVTVLYPDRAGVDRAVERVGDAVVEAPGYTDTYRIYHGFATDPEGRTVEFQTFE